MLIVASPNCELGVALANRLGLPLDKREGHDLAGPCISCTSSDAFRLHAQSGVAQCYSCGGKWSPFQVAEMVIGDREGAKDQLVEIGLFKPSGPDRRRDSDPIESIARQKGISAGSLRAFGATITSPATIQFPCYGPNGKRCTTFTISTNSGTKVNKGLFAKGKPAGLFLPHEGEKVCLPQPGETWYLVEGVKDAAALHAMGYLAIGLNTCRLAAKFGRLFAGVHVVLIPDRDRAGEKGADHSTRVLRGVAASVSVAVLTAEFTDSHGADVRDVLRQPDGEQLVRQALEDASRVEAGDLGASMEIDLPEGEPLRLTVSPAGKRPQRLVTAERKEVSHRDHINTDSSNSRVRFVKKLAQKLRVATDTLEPLIEPKLTELADQAGKRTAGQLDGGDKESQATLAASMAGEWALWHTPGGDAYATIPVDEHQETWNVKSQTIKRYVAKRFFETEGKAINSESLSSAMNLMEAQALFDGDEHEAHVRIAEHECNLYLDLCNDRWQVVEVTPSGWQVIDQSPVRFRRSRGMLALPKPESGGRLEELRMFLNVDDLAWQLIVAWLVATLWPRGPYPILGLFAEQGSGKSTIGRLIRSIVDPNSSPLRSEPRDPRDLMIAADNSWVLAFDNLSYVPKWLSDALCRLSTGGGFATRELYTDRDEIIFDAERAVMLTSIEEVATRSDLLDRLLIVSLPTIPEHRRRSVKEIDAAFEAVRPSVLGALLDVVVGTLRDLPTTKLADLPRMADFAVLLAAAEKSLGWEPGTFIGAYTGNRQSANALALEASPVGQPLLDLLQNQGGWEGSATKLLDALNTRASEELTHPKSWPKTGRSMAGHLKRLAPNLRAAGWNVVYGRESSKRTWTISPTSSSTMTPDATSYHLGFNDAGDIENVSNVGAESEHSEAEWEEGEI